jgi:hypothetical protein
LVFKYISFIIRGMEPRNKWSSWVDEAELFPTDVLEFEDVVSSHGRFVTTAWLPYDDFIYAELYRQIITQMQFVRSVVDSPSLNLKRSKQAANAIHISSSLQADVHASMDIITELVNFRIRSKDYKLKRKPITEFVNVFTIVNYTGRNLIGVRDDETGKNFIVTMSDLFNVKTMISYPDQKTIRVAILGKPKNHSRARMEIEALVLAVGDGEEENKAQAEAIMRAKENTQIKILAKPAPESAAGSDIHILRMPSNVLKECDINTDESVTVSAPTPAAAITSATQQQIARAFETAPIPTPPQMMPPPQMMHHMYPNHHQMHMQHQMFAHIFSTTFNQIFTHSFNSAFHASYAKAFAAPFP